MLLSSVALSRQFCSLCLAPDFIIWCTCLSETQLEPQRVLEKFRAAGEKRAEQEQLLFEQAVSEQRAVEQKALKERQALEKANRYEACLSRAADAYNASRLAACTIAPERKSSRTRTIALSWAFREKVCALAHVVPEASPNCKLPRTVTLSLDADVEKARDRCSEEDKDEPARNADADKECRPGSRDGTC